MSRKSGKFRSLGFWLVTGAWGAGAFIYGWLLAGVLYKREYRSLSFEALGWTDWTLAILCGFIACVLSLLASSSRKSAGKESKQLLRIVVAVLPALFLVAALAVLTLTLATYNGDWIEARQGLATAFAALIAAVGVVVSVAVSYKTGEENRLAQQENLEKQLQSQQENLKTQLESQQKNLETQLEHQRTLEQEKGAREQQKLDAELIKNLNDRLHEIIPRRYGSRQAEVSACYFQLAALYMDWETLATTSDLIGGQKESQQRNILKLLFGVYQEQTQTKGVGNVDNSAPHESAGTIESGSGNKPASRNEVDIRTLNSVIQDIFADYRKDKKKLSEAQDEELMDKEPDSVQYSYDLSYLDLRDLDLSQKDLNHAILKGAHLEGANLQGAHLEGANLQGAHLEGANLQGAHLEGADLRGAHLEGADLRGARLEGAELRGAHLEGADLRGAHLEGANLGGAHLEGANLKGAYLEGADLRVAYLEGADLWDVHLERADLRGAHLESARLRGAGLKGANLGDARLEGADLLGAGLKGARLRGAHLEGARLRGACLEGAELGDAHLEGADLLGARLEGADLRGAHLEGADLGGAHLEGTNLGGAHLEGADLRVAVLEGADLWGAVLEGANLWGAYLEGANLWGAYLEGADLRGAHLEGANLWGAYLEGANLRGAHLEDASFFFFGLDEDTQATSARERIINQLKEAKYLPNRDELLKAQGFDQALVDDIIKAHEEHHKDDQQ